MSSEQLGSLQEPSAQEGTARKLKVVSILAAVFGTLMAVFVVLTCVYMRKAGEEAEEVAQLRSMLSQQRPVHVGTGTCEEQLRELTMKFRDLQANYEILVRKYQELSDQYGKLHTELLNAKELIKSLTMQNDELKQRLNKALMELTEKNQVIVVLKMEIRELVAKEQECQNALYERTKAYAQCREGLATCVEQTKALPRLALDQAKLRLLLQKTGYSFVTSTVYSGSEDGYDRKKFLARVGTKKPTVVVVKSSTGSVFGGAINIAWEETGGLKTDAAAFTFATGKASVCRVKVPKRAVNFDSKYFLEFGNPEILINNSNTTTTTGSAEADNFYECNAPEPTSFYNAQREFTVEGLWAYHVELFAPNSPS